VDLHPAGESLLGQTVGTHVDVSHAAATPPGLEVLSRATLVEIDGRCLRFEIEAHDGFDVISKGGHERFVIDRVRFTERLDRKLSAVSS
jgi:fluoroacetyl-CoA thioesterase